MLQYFRRSGLMSATTLKCIKEKGDGDDRQTDIQLSLGFCRALVPRFPQIPNPRMLKSLI